MGGGEQPLFFAGDGRSLFGVFHSAAGSAVRTPFVFCHPFGEEKLWAHRVFVTFARELASRGHPVLRFDFMGNGDSPGDFESSSVDTALADIGSAIDEVKALTGSDEVGLVGLRLGALFAAIVGDRRTDVKTLVLWAPILDGTTYLQELLRVNLATQMAIYREIRQDRMQLVEEMERGSAVNVDGYLLALPFYTQLSAVTTLPTNQFRGRCLIAQVDRRPDAPAQPALTRLQAAYADAALASVQEEPFWKEIARFYDTAPNLFRTTLQWLDSTASSAAGMTQDAVSEKRVK